ncbi:MAG: ABC transporter ATP-binding protein [Myxococcales bacterium]|nr:ABC transporter ATP-binding protein [Myxococcales bacterium]
MSSQLGNPVGPDLRPGSDPDCQPLVRVQDLRKSFFLPDRKLDVLRGINLEIRPREMVSLVGQSGVGKSTFLHVLGTLDRPTSGQVLFGDQDVFALPDPALAAFRNNSIGFVFQFHHLLPEFTALENVMMPALIHRMAPAKASARASELLSRVGLAARLGHRPGELSGGEQQRVAVARALMMEPPLVLADEPTGNLDQRTADELHDLLMELNEQTSIAFVVATHNFSLARRMRRHLLQHNGIITEMSADEAEAHAASLPTRGRTSH